MRFIKIWSYLLAVIGGLAAVLISIGLLGLSPALAHEGELTGSVRQAAPEQPQQPVDDFVFIVVFTDPAIIDITNLSGNVAGKGTHEGSVRCNRDRCRQKTHLIFTVPLTDPAEYVYKFTTRQVIDPIEERVVVGGKGTISSNGQTARFSFTATFRNNKDGTVWVRYEASRPEASFVIPKSPGAFRIFRRR